MNRSIRVLMLPVTSLLIFFSCLRAKKLLHTCVIAAVDACSVAVGCNYTVVVSQSVL